VVVIDFSKAFDKVNYWKLFSMLLDNGIPVALVHLLVFFGTANKKCVSSGTVYCLVVSLLEMVQDKVEFCLSPYLFGRYIRGLNQSIASSHIGCSIGDMVVNILAYADDIVLLSPSWRGLHVPHRQIDVVCRGYQYDM